MRLNRIKREMGLAGVYVLWSGNRAIYVGQTRNLGQRLSSHRCRKGWDSYSFIVVGSFEKRAELESRLIKRLKPAMNVYTGTVLLCNSKMAARRKLVKALLGKFGPMSSRGMQKTLRAEHGVYANHNTLNTDLHAVS